VTIAGPGLIRAGIVVSQKMRPDRSAKVVDWSRAIALLRLRLKLHTASGSVRARTTIWLPTSALVGASSMNTGLIDSERLTISIDGGGFFGAMTSALVSANER
jgi:hypothetical protein